MNQRPAALAAVLTLVALGAAGGSGHAASTGMRVWTAGDTVEDHHGRRPRSRSPQFTCTARGTSSCRSRSSSRRGRRARQASRRIPWH